MLGLLTCRRWRRNAALPLLSLALALPVSASPFPIGMPLAQDSGAGGQAAQSPPSPGTPQADAERLLELTLGDVLRIALKNNLTLQIEAISTEVSEYDALGSWGSFDPFFSFTGSYDSSDSQGTGSLSGGSVIENDSLGYDTSLNVPFTTGGTLDLTLSHSNNETNNAFAAFDVSTTDVFTLAVTQPLLKGAWSRYATTNQRLAELDYESQTQRQRQIRQQVLRDTSIAYWDLVNTIEELKVREVSVDLGEQQLQQDEKRLEVGVGTEVDVLQSETNVAQQEELRLLAEFNVRTAEDNLRRLVSPAVEGELDEFLDAWDWPIRPLTQLPPDISNMLPDWRRSLNRALANRPELAQRRLAIDVAEIGLLNAHTEWLPTLDFSASVTGVGFDSDPAEAFETAASFEFPRESASLTFSMPILRRSGKNRVRAARANVRSSRLNYESNELDILAEVRAAVRQMSYSGESVAAAVKSRTLAERQLKAEEARQSVGSSTTFQVLQFQEDLATALSTEVAARSAYAKAQVNLDFAEGALDVEGEPTTAIPRSPADDKEEQEEQK